MKNGLYTRNIDRKMKKTYDIGLQKCPVSIYFVEGFHTYVDLFIPLILDHFIF